jgi:hypothetical protein
VTTADLADGAVTSAKIADGAVGTGDLADGAVTSAKIASAAVAPSKLSQPLTLATAQTATGTSIDFTGIPSWAKRVTVMLDGVSTNGTSNFRLQLGTSGGIASSGYVGSVGAAGDGGYGGSHFSNGFDSVAEGTTSLYRYGRLTLLNVSGSRWILAGSYGSDSATTAVAWTFNGAITLSSTLDRVRITTVNGTDSFDAGTINILYE